MNLHAVTLFSMLALFTSKTFAHSSIQLASDGRGVKEEPHISWFTHKKIDTNIWVINDSEQDNIYLIEGEKLALVIDTGLGYQNLKTYVKSLTHKPLVVVNSHAHPDHAGGNHVFEHVHIHKDELETLEYYTSESVMIDTFERFVNMTLPEHLLDKNKTSTSMLTVNEGFKFNLGNRTLEVIHIPGHSPGSIALFDKKSKNMFTGDMTTQHVWLQVKHATSVKGFLSSIRKLQAYKPLINWLLPGHGEPLKPSHLDALEAAAEKILSGECEVTLYSSPLGEEISCHHEGVVIVYRAKEN